MSEIAAWRVRAFEFVKAKCAEHLVTGVANLPLGGFVLERDARSVRWAIFGSFEESWRLPGGVVDPQACIVELQLVRGDCVLFISQLRQLEHIRTYHSSM